MDEGTWADEDGSLIISQPLSERDKLVFIFALSGLETCIYLKRKSVESLVSFLSEWTGITTSDADWWGEDEWI